MLFPVTPRAKASESSASPRLEELGAKGSRGRVRGLENKAQRKSREAFRYRSAMPKEGSDEGGFVLPSR